MRLSRGITRHRGGSREPRGGRRTILSESAPDGLREAHFARWAGPSRLKFDRSRRPAGRATDREVGVVVAAILAGGSEKAAAHRLGLSHSTVKHHLANARSKVGATTAQLVWILGPRLPEPDGAAVDRQSWPEGDNRRSA